MSKEKRERTSEKIQEIMLSVETSDIPTPSDEINPSNAIDDIWIGQIYSSPYTIEKGATLRLQDKQSETLVYTGAGYNIKYLTIARRLGLIFTKLPENVFLRTVTGGKLHLQCLIGKQKLILCFLVSKYTLPYVILDREGLTKVHLGWRQHILFATPN